MRNYLINKNAQSTIEFSMAFILAVLFLFLSCNLFVWFNRNIVQRQKEYERTRSLSASGPMQRVQKESDGTVYYEEKDCKDCDPGKLDFYTTKNPNYKPLNAFVSGGYEK